MATNQAIVNPPVPATILKLRVAYCLHYDVPALLLNQPNIIILSHMICSIFSHLFD